MPDIAMCNNRECHKAARCYRYTGPKSDPWQVYGEFDPQRDKCFMDNGKEQNNGNDCGSVNLGNRAAGARTHEREVR
jgi:hypothetical protein